MANKGKYVDRNPNMTAAGKILEPLESVGDTLQIYSAEEAASNIINIKCRKEIQNTKESSQLGYSAFLPVESVEDLLSPELKKSRFIAFKEKFSEDMFFKKPELGEVQNVQSKPEEYNNISFTYGKKSAISESAYELILPRKTPDQIQREFLKWHDKYIISHNHYLPAERLTRHYTKVFNPQATFGRANKVDTTGQTIKNCLRQCERWVVINKTQKMFLDQTEGRLGEKIDRYNLNLDAFRTYAKPNPPTTCNVRCLLENIQPSPEKEKLVDAICHIHKLRRSLFNRTDFHMHDLKILLNKYDESGTGYINFKAIMKTLRSLRIYADETKLRLAIEQLNVTKKDDEEKQTELVNIDKFWQILHTQYPLPYIPKLSETIAESENKDTTYRLLCKDRNKTLKNVLETGRKHDDDGDRVTAGEVISPDIPMHFGLVPKDFNVLRSKGELKRIFRRALSDENFEKIWQFGLSKRTGKETADCNMSVNEFRAIINEHKTSSKL